MTGPARQSVIVGVSGATGVVYAKRLLEVLRRLDARPQSLADMVDHTVGRVLDLFDLDGGLVDRWTGDKARGCSPAAVIPLPGKVTS